MNERPGKTDMDIEDINLSPAKKKKTKYYSKPRKLRQLIITENSPYLEYLPDMLKKEKEKHKNTIPLGIETQSRKVL